MRRLVYLFELYTIQIIPLFALCASNKWNPSNTHLNIDVTFFQLLFVVMN